MNNIQLLDNSTINKIAAGEVVERPSSVVKELVENSIDAGATSITLEIKEGGTSLIKITDNGNGIPKEQSKTAFLRHATSKIRTIDDLDNIFSLGFRGEALASIASVSQIEMITKTQSEDAGTKIEIDGGEIISEGEIGCSDGTSITVRNLFYNVPARRKFLKKPSTESGYISDMINKIALGHPEISFKYINNDNVILHTSGNNDLKTAVFHVYGKEVSKKMLYLDYSKGSFALKGLIGRPELSRANRTYENLFINGRFVKNNIISSAIEDAYKTRLLIGKFPVYVLNFELPPSMVDVNVHPTKLEVRFNDEEEIYKFVFDAISKEFKEHILIPEVSWESKNSPEVNAIIKNDKSKEKIVQQHLFHGPVIDVKEESKNYIEKIEPKNENLDKSYEYEFKYKKPNLLNINSDKKNIVNEEKASYKTKHENENGISELIVDKTLEEEKHRFIPFFNNYKIVGQVFGTYWIVEQGSSMFLIDQHAAHERVLFEELLYKFKNENIVSQELLQPVVIHLTIREKEILKDNIELLTNFGFGIEEFDATTYALRSVPFIFKGPTGVKFFTDIIDILSDSNIDNIYDTKILAIATSACKAAVKANDKLSFQEAMALIGKLLKLENPFTCPHGRPTIIEMTKYELEKKFKRIQ